MIIVNTTFYVSPTEEAEFMQWVKTDYIPASACAGLSDPMVNIILAEVGEGVTGYAVQLTASTLDVAEGWTGCAGAESMSRLMKGRDGKILFFTTYMENVPL
ncbi:MAG: DUF4286 family protein [Muribaculaceae bacterium]|nr:DUF4286 family protein [Muribaculaceae bacterium]